MSQFTCSTENMLQWQDNPVCELPKRGQSVKRDFIRENICRVKSSSVNRRTPVSANTVKPPHISNFNHVQMQDRDSNNARTPLKDAGLNTKSRTDINYVRANANAVSNGQVRDRRSSSSKPSIGKEPRNVGKVPAYLVRRKKEAERISEEAKAARERCPTPEGHRRVSEEERAETLRQLEEAHAKTLQELARAPLHMNTTRTRNYRSELENRLSDLEEIIRIFHQPTVFIILD